MLKLSFVLQNILQLIGFIRPLFEAASRKYSISCRAFCENPEYVPNKVKL